MIQLFLNYIQPIILYKIGAHVKIDSKKQANKLVNKAIYLVHRNAIHPYKEAYAISHYYQKDKWSSIFDTSRQRPYQISNKQIIKYGKKITLKLWPLKTSNIYKWTSSVDIDKELLMNMGQLYNRQTKNMPY